ncbi:MAG: hypothetical protein ACFWTJ_06730 [Lachnoclostridium sp.]|jgi:hypothetical protein
MKKINKCIILLLFSLPLCLFSGILFQPEPAAAKALPEAAGESDAKTMHVLFVINDDFYNSKVPEFYQLLHPTEESLTVDAVYATGIYDGIQKSISKVQMADQIILLGLLPSKEESDALKQSAKSTVKLCTIATEYTSQSRLDTLETDVLSAYDLWVNLYYAKIADIDHLPFYKPDTKTVPAADLALAVNLQYNEAPEKLYVYTKK